MAAKYNRGSVQDTMRVASAQAQKHQMTVFVWATACGMTIGKAAPPFGQQHYIVTAAGAEYIAAR